MTQLVPLQRLRVVPLDHDCYRVAQESNRATRFPADSDLQSIAERLFNRCLRVVLHEENGIVLMLDKPLPKEILPKFADAIEKHRSRT